MGLDIYTGTLVRYYTRDWKTVVQQIAERSNTEVEFFFQNSLPEISSSEAGQVIDAWRRDLNSQLEPHGVRLDWSEDASLPYFTDKPAWDNYNSLLAVAASVCQGVQAPVPYIGDLESYPAFVTESELGSKSRFGHLFSAQFWLPIDFPFTFEVADAFGVDRAFGSLPRLMAHLTELNDAHFRASESEMLAWAKTCPDFQSETVLGSRFAFALLLGLARKADRHRLPLLLDY